MDREKIIERDFMGLIEADGVAEKKKDANDGLTKNPKTDAPVEDENLSLSNQNFRQHLGSHGILKGQQVASSPCVASSIANPTSIQYSFFPYAGSHLNSTATSKSITVPGNPPCAQLTIFYSGTVNVYDDVPADKAQGLMLLAACARSKKMTNLPPGSSVMSMAMTNGSHSSTPSTFSPNFPNHACPVTVQAPLQKPQVSVQPNTPATVSLNAGDCQTNQTMGTSTSQLEALKSSAPVISPAPVVPRAVPQARKASLARFLEKRKERIITKAPYSSKTSPHGSPQTEHSLNPSKASAPVSRCFTKDHQMTCTGLDNKIPIGSENRESFPEKDQERLYIEKAPKTEKEEHAIAI